jgi:hypothetical protein
MLPPLYFSRLRTESDGIGGTKVIIDDQLLPPGTRFWIRGYANVDNYYLVKWAMGPQDIDEYATGENLWRGQTPIAYGGGVLALYTPPDTSTTIKPPLSEMSVWNRIDSTVGKYGVPADVAVALRNSENEVYF